MQLSTLLVETLNPGKITISQKEKPVLIVNVENNKKINVNATDKHFIKQAISSFREGTTKKGVIEGLHRDIDSAREATKIRPIVKEMVEDLCKEGVTITVSYKGDRAMTVGSEANSKLTRLITKTKGIEINSPKLAEMGI